MQEPACVYHYTSPDGAHSILSKKTFWFTDVEYLNDKCECKIPNDRKQRYVFCASCNSDSIAMWNYYVKNGNYRGYNLGIDVKEFEKVINVAIKNTEDEKCSDKIQIVSKKVRYGKKPKENDLFSKLDNFECEEEYRFVLTVPENYSFPKELKPENGVEGSNITPYRNSILMQKYRVGESGIITPYIECTFTLEQKQELFKRITLAPMVEADLARKSFERFLHKDVYKGVEVTSSTINVRF
jgi:hypothetical protein